MLEQKARDRGVVEIDLAAAQRVDHGPRQVVDVDLDAEGQRLARRDLRQHLVEPQGVGEVEVAAEGVVAEGAAAAVDRGVRMVLDRIDLRRLGEGAGSAESGVDDVGRADTRRGPGQGGKQRRQSRYGDQQRDD